MILHSIFSISLVLTFITTIVQAVDLATLTQILNGDGFLKGEWKANQDDDQFNFLTERKGNSDMVFQLQQTSLIQSIKIHLYNPKYKEGKEIVLTLILNNYDEQLNKWSGRSTISYRGFSEFQQEIQGDCQAQYDLEIIFKNAEKPDENIDVRGFINIVDVRQANFSFYFEYISEDYLALGGYCLFVFVICGISLFSIQRLINVLINQRMQYMSQFSTLTLGFLTFYYWFYFAINLFQDFPNISSPFYMLIPSFTFLVVYYQMLKLFMLVWRFQNVERLMELDQRKRALIILLIQYYGSFAVFCVLIFYFETKIWFILATGLYMIPQVVHNVIQGRYPKLIPEYIFGILAVNMIYPLYFRACPENFRGLQPSILFVSSWIPLYLLQIVFLGLQWKFGPRFFIPNCLLPGYYDYFRKFNIQTDNGECYICLCELSQDPLVEGINTTPLVQSRIMVTPCQHKFHESCLKSWLEIKLECPACRKALPVLP